MRLLRKIGEIVVDVFTDEYRFRREHPEVFAAELRRRERRRRSKGYDRLADKAARRAEKFEARARAKIAAAKIEGDV